MFTSLQDDQNKEFCCATATFCLPNQGITTFPKWVFGKHKEMEGDDSDLEMAAITAIGAALYFRKRRREDKKRGRGSKRGRVQVAPRDLYWDLTTQKRFSNDPWLCGIPQTMGKRDFETSFE
jgi:hypothetical protein